MVNNKLNKGGKETQKYVPESKNKIYSVGQKIQQLTTVTKLRSDFIKQKFA